jgi:small subunit ribosomal protein S1
VEVMILGVDADNKRISLGLKQTQDDPWGDIAQQFTPGMDVTGPITRLQDKGVAVDLGDDVEGFVPLSQLGVTGLQNPVDVFAEGDVLEMRVTEVDPDNRRIVLETTRIPKFEGEQPVLPARAEEAPAEVPAAAAEEAPEDVGEVAPEAAEEEAAPQAVQDEAPVAAEVDEAPVAEAPTEEPAAEAEAPTEEPAEEVRAEEGQPRS